MVDQSEEPFQVVACSLSFVGSFLILLSGWMFPAVSRREVFFQMLLHLAFFDMMIGIGGMMGYPTGDTCITQAVLFHCCLVASFLWNDIIAFNLFTHLAYEKLYLSFFQMNLIVVVCVSILSLVPLAFHMAYTSQHTEGTAMCSLNSQDDDNIAVKKHTEFILLVVFIMPLFCSVVFMGTLSCILLFKIIPERAKENPAKAARMKALARYMALYPIGMVLLWIPNVITFVIYQIQLHTKQKITTSNVLSYTFQIGLMYGAYTSIVFFSNSSSIRKCWISYFERHILGKEESLLDKFELDSSDLRDSMVSVDSVDSINLNASSLANKEKVRDGGLSLQSLS